MAKTTNTEPAEENSELVQPVKPAEEKLKDLVVNIAFTDKYNDKISFALGDVIKANSISKERYEELINDERKIVSVK